MSSLTAEQRKSRIGIICGLIGIIVGVLIITAIIRHVVTIGAEQQATAAAVSNQMAAAATATTVAENTEIASLRKELADVQRQLKKLAEVKKAQVAKPAPIAPAPIAPIAQPAPNQTVIRVLDKAGNGDGDAIVQMWTGVPAVLHELKEGEKAPQAIGQPMPAPTMQIRMGNNSVKEQGIRDCIKQLNWVIGRKEAAMVSIRSNTDSEDPAEHAFLLNRLNEKENELVQLKEKHDALQAELATISPIPEYGLPPYNPRL